ncbi:hypothetical protein [Rhodococcus erythropolis]|uniref:hypothetical protein n=1 Tax=Rhodococcus erythropolis TaxID=1833 RepID=UPI000B0B0930|nr:hypothetical protein [Rhodococcus erythropolis]
MDDSVSYDDEQPAGTEVAPSLGLQLGDDLVASLNRHDFEILSSEDPEILRVKFDKSTRSFHSDIGIPVGESVRLLSQLENKTSALSDHFGFFSGKGYFELMVRLGLIARRGVFDPIALRSVARLSVGDDTCEHDSSNLLAIDSRKYPKLYHRQRFFDSDNPDSFSDLVTHVSDKSGTCIELSPQSPCGVLYGVPNYREGRPLQLGLSIKVSVENVGDVTGFVHRAYGLANSFMYELAVRNRLICEPISRASYEQVERSTLHDERIDEVRFPISKVASEVAELYSFAELANDNLPLAFLSFYQVLEYFFPQAVRRDLIRKVRRELSDPMFSLNSDTHLVRIIGVTEKAGRYSEADQISTLLESAVRVERLREFLQQPRNQTHFGKKGPISGVRAIVVGNQQDSLARQVSERVYQLRNRIVHAKDDPKFLEQKVLLPRSREAARLKPDVDLLRLLARDVITDSQV